MASEKFGESEVPWMKDEFSTQPTILPDMIAAESSQITTVVIFVISALLTITLLFMMAVFIDCRQQKLQKLQPKKTRKLMRIKIPVRIGRVIREDEATIVDKMQDCEPSSSNVIV